MPYYSLVNHRLTLVYQTAATMVSKTRVTSNLEMGNNENIWVIRLVVEQLYRQYNCYVHVVTYTIRICCMTCSTP